MKHKGDNCGKQLTMASKLKSVVDGWENWQIALAVGAPIALGLAGVWYYKRSKNSETAKTPTDKSSSPKNEVQIKVEKAQEAKTKGNKYFKGGRYDLAIECYTEAISICPENQPSDMSTFYQNRAAAYEQLKNHEKVIEDCSRALELHNRYIKAFFRRAKAYELTHQMEKALEDITAVCIMERFENQQSLVMADRVLKEVGKTKAKEAFKNRRPAMPSKQYIKSYFASFANDPVHRWQKTRPQTEQKSPTKAKPDKLGENEDENLNQSSTESDSETGTPQVENHVVNDTYEPSSFEKARDALLTGEYESIIPLCSEGATEGDNPDQALCFLLRATFYFLKGQGELARSDLTTLLTNNDLPKNIKVNALIKRGNLSMEESRQTEALDDLAAAVRVDSTNSDIYFHRGQQNLSMDRTDDALRDFEKCIQLNPAFSAAYVQKCYTEYRSALMNQNPLQLQSAVINFKQAIEKFPFYAEGHILYGQALSDQANFEEADAHFRKASEIQPDNAQSLVHRGLLCLQWKQDIQRAMDFIDQAIRVDDKCGLGYETLGTIEVQRGNMGRAMELFNRAIELCTSEAQMTHLFSLLHAATAQSKVAQGLGLNFPMAS